MPLYDFQCKKCNKSFELSLSLSEREGSSEKKKCPHCSSKEVNQLMTFKGGLLTKGSSEKSADNSCAEYGCPSYGAGGMGGCPGGGMCGMGGAGGFDD
ncbi:MAG: zinc ribbon domain-containing protein [Oligoflexia bacterium]|nr:zinc ribbon domain-containing protein [Oligoflexia bacterium]